MHLKKLFLPFLFILPAAAFGQNSVPKDTIEHYAKYTRIFFFGSSIFVYKDDNPFYLFMKKEIDTTFANMVSDEANTHVPFAEDYKKVGKVYTWAGITLRTYALRYDPPCITMELFMRYCKELFCDNPYTRREWFCK